MTQDTQTLTIQLLGRAWQIRCADNETKDLQKCAQLLNNKMQEIAGNKITSQERIIIMAAMNAIHELIQQQNQKDLYIESLGSRIRELQQQLADALKDSKK